MLTWAGGAISAAHAEAPSGPSLIVQTEGTPVQAELRDAAGLFIPACRALEWQRFDANTGRFVPVPLPGCAALAPAARIASASQRFEAPPQLRPGDNVRVIVVLAEGCVEGKAMPTARCTSMRTVESKPATIPAPAP